MIHFVYLCIMFITLVISLHLKDILYLNKIKKNRIKIIIVSCPKDGLTVNLNITLLPFEADIIMCNKTSNSYDAREAGLMLDYIINNYNNIKYDTLLFLHDHDKSSHYPTSITNRINKISKERFIYENDLIGVNCFYYDSKYWNKHLTYHRTEIVEKYLTENGVDHVKISHIRQNKYIMPCCASFFVKTKLIYLHNRKYYILLRNSLLNFSLYGFKRNISNNLLNINYRNYLAACYMEFSWTTMFGKKNVPFPPDCNISINSM